MPSTTTDKTIDYDVYVSLSELDAFRRCPRKWYYEYCLGYTPKVSATPLILGSFWAQIMEAYYTGDPAVIPQLLDKFATQNDDPDAEGVLESCFELYTEDMVRLDKEYKATASEVILDFVVDIQSGGKTIRYAIGLRADMLLTCGAELWVMEHKLSGRKWDPRRFDFETQRYLYPMACRKHGYNVEGLIYNITPKRVGGLEPRLIAKDTKVSKAAAALSGTTYRRYREKIQELGLDPLEYEAELQTLRDRYWVQRYPLIVSDIEVEAYYNKVLVPLVSYMDAVRSNFFPPMPTHLFSCTYDCSFLDPCEVSFGGGDDKLVLQDTYKLRTHKRAPRLEDVPF